MKKKLGFLLLSCLLIGACKMRSYEEIERLKSTLFQQQTESAISSLPPGFINGLELNLNKEYKITISPGLINVNGKKVLHKENYTLTDGDWSCPKVQGHWYYIYISDVGKFYIDLYSPTFSTSLFAYYHPQIANYRNVGKLYYHETYYGSAIYKIIYVQAQITTENTTMVIAPSTYSGDNANYYCDGLEDQKLINAAISFLYNAYGGGEVKLLTGTFLLSASIYLTPGLTVSGENWGTIIKSTANGYKFTYMGSSADDGKSIILKDFAIDSYSTEIGKAIFIYYISRIYVNNLKIENQHMPCLAFGYYLILNMENCSVAYSRMEDYSTANKNLIFIWGSYANDVITNIQYNRFIENDGYGIYLYHIYQCIISNNAFYTNRGTCIKTVICHDAKIENNIFAYCCVYSYVDIKDYVIMTDGSDRRLSIANNNFKNCGNALYISGYDSIITSNIITDSGNLIDNSAATITNPPMIFNETVPVTSNATFARSSTYYRQQKTFWRYATDFGYSYLFTKTIAAGTDAYVALVDAVAVADLHEMAPNREVVFSLWVYVPTGSPAALSDITIRIGEYYSAAWHYTSSSNPTAFDTWQVLSVTVTLNTAIAGFLIDLYCASTAPVSSVIYVNDVRLYVTGRENYHNQHYYDVTKDSTVSGNSWQQPYIEHEGGRLIILPEDEITSGAWDVDFNPTTSWTQVTSLMGRAPYGVLKLYGFLYIIGTDATPTILIRKYGSTETDTYRLRTKQITGTAIGLPVTIACDELGRFEVAEYDATREAAQFIFHLWGYYI